MPISMNVDIIIGITLISFGVYTFAKGTSQKISEDIYLKSWNKINVKFLNGKLTYTKK